MKVVSIEALTKLIQLVKSTFIKVDDVVQAQEVTLATVATTGDYDDLTNKPTAGTGIDITNNVISVTSPTLVNTATGEYSVTINGKSTSQRKAYNIGKYSSSLACGVAYGYGADAGEFGVSIGYASDCNSYGVALGYNAYSTLGSIQIGYGKNSRSMTMAVGFYNGTTSYEYQLLDGTTGLIPDARISSNIARDADVVHKSGNETISDLKNFSNDGSSSNGAQIELTATNIDASSAPANNKYAGLLIKDTNGKRVGKLETIQFTDGSLRTLLDATNLDGRHGQIAVQIATDGTVSTIAPTPATSDNSTKIATTAFVKSSSSGYSTYTSGASISSNTDYTIPNNGVIAGEISAAQSGSVKVNIGDVTVEQVGAESGQRCRGPFYAIVKKGQVVKLVTSGNATVTLAKFYAFS